ncbi:hypothetical protein Bpfe_031034 [Biomphalaria pfeifferi]|uniref:Uncharacterized protein n=1 Tax=Biomphalaria pfeifferi TaxID=112525 RepID=A0AAD8AQ89_BIOPF|nr:hypothetical protein Bpfe_031034 [Biomphalaria pfeifferi]
MSDTQTNRGYAWGLQTNFTTQKTIAAGALKQILAMDNNFIDYTPATKDDEDWAHGVNSATDQWIEAHDANVQHSIPGHSQELGKVFYLNLGQYQVATPSGGTTSKEHSFKPTDPTVTRQDKSVTYAEYFGAGWNVLMPRAVSDGFTLKGDGLGVLTCDFSLLGAGLIIPNSGVTWYPTATPTVTRLSGLHKLFNTQVGLVVTDGGTPTTYACRYRSFEVAFKKTMLSDAGYKPGGGDFAIAGTSTSGVIRSAHEFDKQMVDFSFVVDMATGSPEFIAVQQQKPLDILLTATGGIIEGSIAHKLSVILPLIKYKTSKPTVTNGIATFTISGKAFYDFTSNKMLEIKLINDVLTYASAF